MPSQEGQRFTLMLSQCCVTLGWLIHPLKLVVPMEVRSARGYGSSPGVSVSCVLVVGLGVTFLLEGQKWGSGQFRPLSHSSGTEITGELGLDGCGLRSSLRDQVVASAAFHPSKHLQELAGRQVLGHFPFSLPRPCPPQVPTASSVI